MNNPFEIINARLNVIEHLLQDLKQKLKNQQKGVPKVTQPYTIQQAAKFLNLAVPTIYNLVSRNEIPYNKPPGTRRLYFLQQDLEAWIKSGRKKTLSEINSDTADYLQHNKKGGLK